MKTINIIGAGRVGKSLGYLFYHHHIFKPEFIFNRKQEKGQAARQFIGEGKVVTALEALQPADITLIAVADDKIVSVTQQLAALHLFRTGDIIFHCSGALGSSLLRPWVSAESAVASCHPVLSFSQPRRAPLNCYCTLEGDEQACQILQTAFMAIGAKVLCIQPKQKLNYHTGMVMASNCFIGLISIVVEQFCALQIDGSTTLKMIEPLVQQCLEDMLKKGPKQALTGPISRGDWQLVNKEIQQLKKNNLLHAKVYELLGLTCLDLLQGDETLSTVELEKMRQVLERN